MLTGGPGSRAETRSRVRFHAPYRHPFGHAPRNACGGTGRGPIHLFGDARPARPPILPTGVPRAQPPPVQFPGQKWSPQSPGAASQPSQGSKGSPCRRQPARRPPAGRLPASAAAPFAHARCRRSRPIRPTPAGRHGAKADNTMSSTEMPTQKTQMGRTVFSDLDEISPATSYTLDAAIGETVQLGRCTSPRGCATHARRRAYEHRRLSRSRRSDAHRGRSAHLHRVGIRRSPGLQSVEHQIYNVWLTNSPSPQQTPCRPAGPADALPPPPARQTHTLPASPACARPRRVVESCARNRRSPRSPPSPAPPACRNRANRQEAIIAGASAQ